MNALIDFVTDIMRGLFLKLARLLNSLSGGRLTPDMITLTGLFMHLPIAYLIARGYFLYGALLLIIFGLFDALDGALAKIQGKTSNAGMLLDASTDKFKEVLLYIGAAYVFISSGRPYGAVWAVAACGAGLCVSYVKAKGETAAAGSGLTPNEVNRLFQDGLARFQIRMALLIVGLVSSQLLGAIVIIALLSSFTAVDRLIKISRKLG
jgi:CDP-diacylglycerol--glycerol-3-phosphate 3-phosphatidyltransferase